MKCYYHPQVDAVAICKHCHKGLCPECAVDVGGGVACKTSSDNCQAEVKFAVQSYAANKRRYFGLRRYYSQWAFMVSIPGVVFTLYGLANTGGNTQVIAPAMLVVGILFLLLAAYFYRVRGYYPAG
jgi:hypothetical protein